MNECEGKSFDWWVAECGRRGRRIEEMALEMVCIKSRAEGAEEEADKLRMQLAACGTAAMQNIEESREHRLKPGEMYYSASYGDVCAAVDREIALRLRAERLEGAMREIKKQSAEWGSGQNTLIRTGFLIVDGIVDKALSQEAEGLRK